MRAHRGSRRIDPLPCNRYDAIVTRSARHPRAISESRRVCLQIVSNTIDASKRFFASRHRSFRNDLDVGTDPVPPAREGFRSQVDVGARGPVPFGVAPFGLCDWIVFQYPRGERALKPDLAYAVMADLLAAWVAQGAQVASHEYDAILQMIIAALLR